MCLYLAHHLAVVTEKSLWSSQKFFTWSYEVPMGRGKCREYGCLTAAGRQEMGWSRFWAPAPTLCMFSAAGNLCLWTAHDTVFTGIKKSWHSLVHEGSELDGIHCKVRHGVLISAICGCLWQVWDVTWICGAALLWNLSTPKPSATVTELGSHLLRQWGVKLSI